MPKILCIKILTGSSLLPRCPGLEHSITFTTMLHVDDRKLLFPPKHFLGTPKTSWELTWQGLSNVTISCRAGSVGTFRTQKKGGLPRPPPWRRIPFSGTWVFLRIRWNLFVRTGTNQGSASTPQTAGTLSQPLRTNSFHSTSASSLMRCWQVSWDNDLNRSIQVAYFDEFYRSLPEDSNKRGEYFEKIFIPWFLKTDPVWSTKVNQVWLWDDYPQRWGKDCGIDLKNLFI